MPDTSDASSRTYKEVRGLSRGLDVLRALNGFANGQATTSALARFCKLDRTTTKRLLETLRRAGLVRPTERDGEYVLTFEVRRLSDGFHDDVWIERVARPLMHEHLRQLMWPCDLGTLEAGFMVVRESTHRWSRLSQHRTMMGERMPVFETALGRAYLAACDEQQRDALLKLLSQRNDKVGAVARNPQQVQQLVAVTRARGYAFNSGEWLPQLNFSAVAVPLHAGTHLLGAMNMVFPRNSISTPELEQRWLPLLQDLSVRIGTASRSLLERQ